MNYLASHWLLWYGSGALRFGLGRAETRDVPSNTQAYFILDDRTATRPHHHVKRQILGDVKAKYGKANVRGPSFFFLLASLSFCAMVRRHQVGKPIIAKYQKCVFMDFPNLVCFA